MKAATAKIAMALLGAGMLAGCIGTREHRGHVLDAELVTAVQVGTDNKESVERLLGRPTFTSEFDANDWYYVSRDTKSVAFVNPRLLDQTVLHITFDQAGNVAAVETRGRELVARVNPSNDKTPTVGRKRTLFEDLFGNIGTVNSPSVPSQGY
ncbi:MAG TPA: outer membrane protein assembly factor BamE [Sphingomicrobium sp.]|nr:outer membrane protein assembly factor BamE [Sphingomicrobium sp.]